MSKPDEVTVWLKQFVEGDSVAASQIWEAYWERLVSLARSRLRASRRRVADEEDVAAAAFASSTIRG